MAEMRVQTPRVGLNNVVVDISGMAVSSKPNDVVITYSLGSCLGLVVFDPVARVGGMVHCMLPLSRIDTEKAKAKPGMFVDTGVPALLEKAFKLGAQKKRIVLKAAGCAHLLDDKNLFRIGERNHTVLRKLLWKNNLLLESEQIGGSISRTLRLYLATGEVTVATGGKETAL
ncbi:MAG: chemotaxis protein CheD [Gemmatimonadota bacterium]|nr:chemotaxis protein CheD [Gemmatimonadota bacterium]